MSKIIKESKTGCRFIDKRVKVDCVDNTNYSEGQLRTRIEDFLEMLADRL
ncbi:MAG: hypothetical protein HQK75_05055 [Candidatus Magnetomorum sp.]|nr:hypothetical protein [Candidatus Magnetomorum sp.]